MVKRGKKKAPAVVGRPMTADEYFEHWKARKVWKHLLYKHHQKRLAWCANRCWGTDFADVGCMLGHSTDIMAKISPGIWTGIDFSAAAIEGARKAFPGLQFQFFETIEQASWILAGKFDTVVCSEVIEHIEDDAGFLRGLYNMARARIILTTPHIDAQDPGHVRIYTDESLEALLAGYACRVEKDDRFFYIEIYGGLEWKES